MALLSLVSVCTSWSPHLLHGKFLAFTEYPRGTLLEDHSMDVLLNVDGVVSGHHLVDDRMPLLLATLLWGSHSAAPRLERTGMGDNLEWSKHCIQTEFGYNPLLNVEGLLAGKMLRVKPWVLAHPLWLMSYLSSDVQALTTLLWSCPVSACFWCQMGTDLRKTRKESSLTHSPRSLFGNWPYLTRLLHCRKTRFLLIMISIGCKLKSRGINILHCHWPPLLNPRIGR